MVKTCQFHIATDTLAVNNDNFTSLLTSMMVKNGRFQSLLTSSERMAIWHIDLTSNGQKWQFHIEYWHLVTKNGRFHIITDILVQWQCYILLTSSSQEWHFHQIATDIYLVKNGIFPLLLTSSGQEWQWANLTPRSADRCSPPNASWNIYSGMYLATILDSSRKGDNFLLFLNN